VNESVNCVYCFVLCCLFNKFLYIFSVGVFIGKRGGMRV